MTRVTAVHLAETVPDLPRHIHHTDDEAFYLLEGELEVEFEGQKYSVTPGTFMLLAHGIPHQVTRISQTPPRLLQISSPGGFEHMVEDLVEAQAIGDLPPEKLACDETIRLYQAALQHYRLL